MSEYDLAIIGSGPGGYVAAIRASQLGLKTIVIESREVGGTCLNRGCIPTKTLLHSAEAYHNTRNLEALGITASEVSFDMKKIYDRKEEVSAGLRNGIEQLFNSNKISLMNGTAMITAQNTITVSGEQITQVTADNIIIATGGKPTPLPVIGSNLPNVFNSDNFLSNKKMFNNLTIIGGGVIGVEFASIYNSLGCNVAIIEGENRLLPRMEKEISQNTAMILKNRGIKIYTSSKLKKINLTDELICIIDKEGEEFSINSDAVLIAIGRKPNTDELFDESIKIKMNNGFIEVDDNFCTNISNIYAVGDVIGGALAHQAAAQGTVAAEKIAGVTSTINLNAIPNCVYINPEIASVGMTQEEAKKTGIEIETGKFIMSANGRTLIDMQDRGFVKLVFDKESTKLLGAQLMCARATDLISELATAISIGLTRAELTSVIRPHPSFSEAITEAALASEGIAIHAPSPTNRRR